MKLKAVLILFLLFFASTATMALVSASIGNNHAKRTYFALESMNIQPAGGDPIDDPVAPSRG